MTGTMNIQGMDKGMILAALYNAIEGAYAKLHIASPPLSTGEAAGLIDENPEGWFDKINYRTLKLRFRGNCLETNLYDLRYGKGAATKALWEKGLL